MSIWRRLATGLLIGILFCCSTGVAQDAPATDIAALQRENDALRLTIKMQQKKIDTLTRENAALKARTPEEVAAAATEKQSQEADGRVAKVVDSHSEHQRRFRVSQATEDGCLCDAFAVDQRGNESGTVIHFFLFGLTNKQAIDGSDWVEDIYWVGNYSYTSVMGATTTVNSYSLDRQDAIKRVKALSLDKAPGG